MFKIIPCLYFCVYWFQVEMPIKILLDAPTISEMAEAVLIHKTHQIGPEEMERLLDETETSSKGD